MISFIIYIAIGILFSFIIIKLNKIYDIENDLTIRENGALFLLYTLLWPILISYIVISCFLTLLGKFCIKLRK